MQQADFKTIVTISRERLHNKLSYNFNCFIQHVQCFIGDMRTVNDIDERTPRHVFVSIKESAERIFVLIALSSSHRCLHEQGMDVDELRTF